MDDDAGDVALAQYAHQFVGADQRADRSGDGADAGDRGEHQRKVRTVAVDEADAAAFANAARDQTARDPGRFAIEFGEADSGLSTNFALQPEIGRAHVLTTVT